MIKSPKNSDKKGRVSLRLLLGIAILGMLPVLLWADNSGPTWWRDRGIQNPNKPANDYAAANQGQLKNFATAAYQEFEEKLPDGAKIELYTLAAKLSGTTANTNDYAAVNLGQLKAVTKPFYDRLLSVGYHDAPLTSGTYPWAGKEGVANDYAMANIGQVKNLFSFDLTQFVLTIDTDCNGLPDSWENQYFGHIGVSGTSIAPRNDGLTILQAFEQKLNPIDFYDGQVPTITVLSGTNQSGDPGTFLDAPLVIQVSGSNGTISNAPVLFLMSGGGGFSFTKSSGTNAYLLAKTDLDGKAQVFFQLPPEGGRELVITAGPGSGSFGNVVTFVAYSNGIPAVPTLLSGTKQADGFHIFLADGSHTATDFVIERTGNGGDDWILSGTETVSTTGNTNYLDPTATDGIFYIYRVSGKNQFGCSAPSNEISILGTDPEVSDSDGDGIPDATEVRCGTNPLDPTDGTLDTDGDGYPNIYEHVAHFDPRNPYWTPPADFTVDLSGTNGAKTNIQDAIDAVTQDYQIIQVNPGTYIENLTISAHKLLLISSSGAASTIINGNHNGSVLTIANDSVISGFTFTTGSSGTGGGVFIQSGSPRLTNCVIVSNSAASGMAIYTSGSAPTFLNCTIANNVPTASGVGEAVANVSGSLTLINSIVWNPSANAELSSTNSVNASYSDIRVTDGPIISGSGNLNADPLLTPDGHLTVSSTCIGVATSTFVPEKDMDGEFRSSLPDIGADQFVDSERVGLPDYWQMKYFGSLGLDPSLLAKWEGLTYAQAYQQGIDPTDYYHGSIPTLLIDFGDQQPGKPGFFAPLPCKVRVLNASSLPFVNAPVRFQITSGDAQLSAEALNGSDVTMRTDSDGYAQVYFTNPTTSDFDTCILATTASTSGSFTMPCRTLLADWGFQDGQGNTVSDQSDFHNKGDIYGGSNWATGQNDPAGILLTGSTAILLNGSTQSIKAKELSVYSVDSGENFSITAWVQLPSGPLPDRDMPIFSMGTESGAQFQLALSGSLHQAVYASLSVGSDFSLKTYGNGENPFLDPRWHHVTFVRNGDTGQIFVDGILYGQSTEAMSFGLHVSGTLRIGSNAAGDFFAGKIQKVCLYASALTQVQIAALVGDADHDGLADIWERSGFNDDPDGDGYPNIYEYVGQSDSTNSSSIPQANFIVDKSGADGTFSTIQTAINAVTKDYQIIKVNPGTYTENLTISAYKLLLISNGGAASTIIDGNHEGSVLTIANDSVINGFTITNGVSGTGGGVFIQSGSPRLTNCVILANQAAAGSAVFTSGSAPTFLNCTIANNPVAGDSNEAVANVSGSLTLINTIVWNPSANPELSGTNRINATYCDVRMAAGTVVSGSGNINTDPQLTPDGHLWASIGHANPSFAPQHDMDGESRVGLPEGTLPDIGADQFVGCNWDGIPRYWQQKYFGDNPGEAPSCANGDTLLHAYQQGFNPLDYYAATTPVITIFGGNSQTGDQNTLLSNPLTVAVKDTNQNPLINAPVTFTVTQGGGQVISSGATSSSLIVQTNGVGVASVQFKLPNTQGTPCSIVANAASEGQSSHAQVTFTASSNTNTSTGTGTGTGTGASTQSSISTTLNADGSIDVTWQNPPDSHSPIPIKVRQVDGSMKVIATVPAGTTSYHIPAQ